PVICNLAGGDTCNTANSVTVQNPVGSLITLFAGTQFQLYDDDDFNDDNGTLLDGDTGEDIPDPSDPLLNGTALLTGGSDVESTNVFAPAYVQPVYDLPNPRNNCLFQANTIGGLAENLRPLFTPCWDSSATNTDQSFWSVLVFGAYQDNLAQDHDPSAEGISWGIVDAITLHSDDGEGSGALIFTELHRPHETPGYTNNPANLASMANTVAHEVGHLFSCRHGEQGLMGNANGIVQSSQFTPTSIHNIRILLHP
ncbi:MAG: hypothetical protein ABI999_11865, partial [Acidobacteriota bacterium]